MGCIGSKPVEAPVVPAKGSDVQKQSDDSNKPWKKNQVVPAPQPAGSVEGAGSPSKQRQQAKGPSAAFAAAGKDTSPVLDQAPADVLADLKALCSARVEGAELANLAERLHDVLKHHLSGALRLLASSKEESKLLEVAKRTVACCSSILQPLLVHINRLLSNRQAGSSWSETTSWEQVEFADFLGMLEDACIATYDQGVMEVGRPMAALMELIHELRQYCDAHKIRIEDSTFRVPALDELMAMLGIIYFRKVVLETSDSAQVKLDQYLQLQEQVGWSDAQLGTCTGPEARAMLFYLHQVSASGEKRTNVTVRRSAAFWDAFECARRDGLLPSPSGPMCHKYFPLFVEEHVQSQAGAAGAGRKPAVEAGEGHGPRKEFFSLAGQDMVGQPPQPGGDAAPEPAKAAPQRPPLWVFNRTAGTYWYNTTLVESPELRGAYAFAGWLLGQSLLNRAPLGLPLPPILFRALLEAHGTDCGSGGSGFQPTLDMLAEFDPDAATGVRNVAALPPDQLRAMLELESLPTDWTAERYTQHAAAEVLRESVSWQSGAVGAGFFAAVDRRMLRTWQLSPAALATLVAGAGSGGDAPADLSALFRLAVDDELSGPSAVLVELLWQVLAGWPAERRLRFVEFVTGTSRLPLPGSELLKIQAPFVAMGTAEHKAALGMLPQAHTCDNLLELPNYWESLLATRGIRGGPVAVSRGTTQLTDEQMGGLREEARRILDERLEIAVMNFQGYGLDERSGGRSGDDDDDEVVHDVLDAKALVGPEASVEPDLALKPAALTADSLASLARLSVSSSMPQSSHPLTFSAIPVSPPLAQRAARQASGSNVPGGRGVRGSVPAIGSVPQQQPQQLHLSLELNTLTDAERQATILARFDVDTAKQGSTGGPPRPQVMKRVSSTEESHDAFK